MTAKRILLVGVVAAILAGAGLWRAGLLPLGPKAPTGDEAAMPPGPPGPPGAGGPRPGMRRGGDGPVPVIVAEVRRDDVPVHVEGIGTVQADATVTVRPQVSGRLLELGFRDGQDVEAGQVLARIDPATYRAVYDQAVAKRDQNEADLRNARADLERYERLAKSESGSRQQADTQRAAVAKLEAQLRIDQGQIDAARIDLDNTVIRAPIGGRTGIRVVDAGNLVQASDSAGIVTIARLKPISVAFTVPQQRLAALLAAQGRGPVPVEVLDGDRRRPIESGTVSVVDNQVDTATGTVRVRASLPNADLRLWPGQFVDVRLTVDVTRAALVVPSAAVQRSAEGTFVYVVDGETAKRRPIAVARQDDGRAVIADGLTPGETVVTTGFARLTDGATVRPTTEKTEAGEPSAAPAPTATPAESAGKGRRPPGEPGRPREPGAPTGPAGGPRP